MKYFLPNVECFQEGRIDSPNFGCMLKKVGKTNLLCHRSKVRVNTVTWKLTERIAATSSLSWEIPPQRLQASICPKLYILLQYLQHPQHCFTVCMAYFQPQEEKIRLLGGFCEEDSDFSFD